MSELFGQLGFVSAVLAGLAFTFVGGLLSSTSGSKAYPWTFGSALVAAVSLTVAAVGAVFAGLGVASELVSAAQTRALHQLVSQTFLVGIIGLLTSAALVGWLRSRRLGIASSVIGLLGFIALGSVVLPFLTVA